MKKNRLLTVSLNFTFALTILSTRTGSAAEATVVKVKGRQAIVQFPSDFVPAAGDKIEVGPAGSNVLAASTTGATVRSSGESALGKGGREHSIGGSVAISSMSNSTSNSSSSTNATYFDLSLQYGWNREILEVGPIAGLGYRSASGGSSTTFQGGAFLDYNLLPNRPGVEFAGGLGGSALLGQTSSSSGGSSTSLMNLAIGAQMKYFCLGNQTALRGDLLYDYNRQANNVTATQSGILAKIGLMVYL